MKNRALRFMGSDTRAEIIPRIGRKKAISGAVRPDPLIRLSSQLLLREDERPAGRHAWLRGQYGSALPELPGSRSVRQCWPARSPWVRWSWNSLEIGQVSRRK